VRLWKAGRPDWKILSLSMNSSECSLTVQLISDLLSGHICCILRGPGGEHIVGVVPGGTEIELKTGS